MPGWTGTTAGTERNTVPIQVCHVVGSLTRRIDRLSIEAALYGTSTNVEDADSALIVPRQPNLALVILRNYGVVIV